MYIYIKYSIKAKTVVTEVALSSLGDQLSFLHHPHTNSTLRKNAKQGKTESLILVAKDEGTQSWHHERGNTFQAAVFLLHWTQAPAPCFEHRTLARRPVCKQ